MTTAPRVLLVTGTDTDVGKTIATAALAVALAGSVAVHKPTQTGVLPGDQGDVDVVRHLTGVAAVSEGVRLPDPMAPVAAAARAGIALPDLSAHVARVRVLADAHDHVLVEGAGGLLVALDDAGHTLADLALSLGSPVVVVCRSGLGTLNHTGLTLEGLAHRAVPVAGLILGSWPTEPTAVELSNREHLAGLGVPLLAALPSGAGSLSPEQFQAAAPTWFAAGWPES